MTVLEVIQLVLGSGGVVGILLLIYKLGRVIERIEYLGRDIYKVHEEIGATRATLREVKNEILDVKERVSFIESFVFFSEIQAESNNPRSDAAKKMWERRKMKKLESRK
jgi:hypothetical protein